MLLSSMVELSKAPSTVEIRRRGLTARKSERSKLCVILQCTMIQGTMSHVSMSRFGHLSLVSVYICKFYGMRFCTAMLGYY